MRSKTSSIRDFPKIEVSGDNPLPRFGHTMTPISKTKVILFGGATGDTGRYSITGDTYSYDMGTRTWSRLENISGIAPSPRAAHASSSVEVLQMVVYGGATGGGSLASDDLYLLDMRSGEDQASWMIVPVVGSTPGRRYGHSLVFIKPHLLVFGGNTGSEAVNDVWCLNVERAPFSWQKLEITGEVPRVRVYHSACLCQTGSAMGMMVIYGGRTSDQSALNDTWGLRRHRDGRWDWVRAPYKPSGEQPVARYQHSALFMGATMLVIGGRTNLVGETVPMEAYDTENSEWFKFPAVQRFRHSSWSLEADVYVHGGFEHETPNIPTDSILRVDCLKLFGKFAQLLPKHLVEPQVRTITRQNAPEHPRPLPKVPRNNNKTPEIRLASQVFVSWEGEMGEDKGELVRNVSIDRLQEEGKRLGVKALPPGISKNPAPVNTVSSIFFAQLLKPRDWSNLTDAKFRFGKDMVLSLIEECLKIVKNEPTVMRLRAPVKIFGNLNGQYKDLMRFFETWGEPSDRHGVGDIECFDYVFLGDYVDRGTHSLETICLLMALKSKYPDQVVLLRGHHEEKSINQFYGLGEECASRLNEDITDPNSVFMKLNEFFEYLSLAAIVEEKILCLHGGIGHALRSIDDLEALAKPIEINHDSTEHSQQVAVDALFSDPCENERETGFKLNTFRDSAGNGNIVKFGADRLQKFLTDNRLSLVIRSHECVIEGYDRSASGELITIFSATDYCGKYKNSGAFLVVKRNLEMIPKPIYSLNDPSSWIDTEDTLKRRPATPPRWKSRAS